MANARQPTNIPAKKPHKISTALPIHFQTSTVLSPKGSFAKIQPPKWPYEEKTLKNPPKSVPKTTASSSANTFLATCIFPANLGISPTETSTVKTPAEASSPKLSPQIPRKTCFKKTVISDIYGFSLPVRRLDQGLVHICLIHPHFYLNRGGILRNPPSSDMIEKQDDPHSQPH